MRSLSLNACSTLGWRSSDGTEPGISAVSLQSGHHRPDLLRHFHNAILTWNSLRWVEVLVQLNTTLQSIWHVGSFPCLCSTAMTEEKASQSKKCTKMREKQKSRKKTKYLRSHLITASDKRKLTKRGNFQIFSVFICIIEYYWQCCYCQFNVCNNEAKCAFTYYIYLLLKQQYFCKGNKIKWQRVKTEGETGIVCYLEHLAAWEANISLRTWRR